jgi:hypothetical protein
MPSQIPNRVSNTIKTLVLCGISFLTVSHGVVPAVIATENEPLIRVRTESDQTLTILVSNTRRDVIGQVTATFVPEKCVDVQNKNSLLQATLESSDCADSSVSLSLSQAGEYSLSSIGSMVLLITVCEDADATCTSTLEKFKPLFIGSVDTKELSQDQTIHSLESLVLPD